MRPQRRDTMTDAEISILALEIMKDLQSLSTKTNIDPDDSFLSQLDTDDDIDDLLSDIDNTETVIEHHSQISDIYPPTNKYNIVPLQPTDSLHDIPPLPDTTNPFSFQSKPTNLSIHIPQVHYHYSGNKKRATKMKNNNNYIPMPMDSIISPSISINSASKSRSITGYSPYNSSIPTNSTSISISPNRSPIYSNQKFMSATANIPTAIDISSLSPNVQYSKSVESYNHSLSIASNEYKKRNKKRNKKLKNKNKIRYHKTPVPKSNRKKNIKRSRKYRSDELNKINKNYYENSTKNVMKKLHKNKIRYTKTPVPKSNRKKNDRSRKYRSDELNKINKNYYENSTKNVMKKLKNKKNKIRYNKTPVPKSNRKKNVKFDRSRKYRSDELNKINPNYYENYYQNSTKSLMNEFNLNIQNKFNKNRNIAPTETFNNDKYINTISPQQPLPFFVKRGAVPNHLQYGKSMLANIDMETEMDNIKQYSLDLESDKSDSTLFKAQNIRYLYNNESNNLKKNQKKKRRKNKKNKRNKKMEKLNVRNVNERRSVTPVPKSKNNIHMKRHNKYRSNSIEMSNNNEYMIEFDDGFIFVNE